MRLEALNKFINLEKLIEWGFILGAKLAYCAAIIAACAIMINLTNKLTDSFFNSKINSKKFVDPRKSNTMKSIVFSVTKYTFYFIAGFSILTVIGVPVESLLAVAGIGSVAIGFGAKSLVEDMIEGFFILLEDQYGVGDIVTIEGRTGTVEEITIRTTRLRGADGTIHIIPNGSIGIITNMCKDYINAIVNIDIDYSEDMDKVLKILNDEMEKSFETIEGLKNRPVVLGIVELDESAVTVRITAECEIRENYRIERELKLAIKKRLDKENITIPFPQRTIHVINSTDKD